MPNVIDPLPFTLLDGNEYHFLMTMKNVKDASRDLKLTAENASAFGLEVTIRSMFNAMVDKPEGMTQEQFENLLPGDPEIISGFMDFLRLHCSPKQNENYRPTKRPQIVM